MIEHVLSMSGKVLLAKGLSTCLYRQQVMKGSGEKDGTHGPLRSCEGGADGAGSRVK